MRFCHLRLSPCKMSKRQSKSYILLSDFGNIVKAFIGANYLTISYAFTKSGLLPGIILLIIIATVTDHCCHLIIKCKYQAIRIATGKTKSLSESTLNDDDNEPVSQDVSSVHSNMVRNISYGDIGRTALGFPGFLAVNACIFFTQFGFCIGYFIFIGNTIYSLFPSVNTTKTITVNDEFILDSPASSSQSSVTIYNITGFIDKSTAPDLRLLVLTPIPIFIVFALIKDIRQLGVISVCANLSILLGGIVTLVYISTGFSISSDWHLIKWLTLPTFFGMVTSSYEGIGTIIPIESSMEGNHHNFAPFLHSAVFILSGILTTFGVVGYLRYGDTAEQMLNKNIPTSTPVGMAINICLCFGILLTFPLQIYPVIEISEILLLRKKIVKIGSSKKHDCDDEAGDDNEDSKTALLPGNASVITLTLQAPAWKRNILRVIIILIVAGLALVLRDFFAYVGALVGALGSSVLAYVLPCLFHLKLCGNSLSAPVKVKDYCIIIFGVLASIISLYTTISDIVSKSH